MTPKSPASKPTSLTPRLDRLCRLRALLSDREAQATAAATARFARYRREPVTFIREVLDEHPWSRQVEIAESVVRNRRTAVPSCHDAGKSFIVSRLAAWWLSVHAPGEAFLVSTAPTYRQVRAILWREINRAHARGTLPGRVNQSEWWIGKQLVGLGQKPADYDAAAFQGLHARYVLVIMDEACGIAGELWAAADSLIANEDSRLIAIGNPDDPASAFAEACRPGSGWHVMPISAFETPNFTAEPVADELGPLLVSPVWVEEKRRRWGEDSPLWQSKVLGRFAAESEDALILAAWVRAAQERELAPGEPGELGVDVARFGADKTVIVHRRGPSARVYRTLAGQDTMRIAGEVIDALKRTGAEVAKIDVVGIGAGVVDRLIEQGLPVLGVNVGLPAREPERFVNLRAEAFWSLRERLEEGAIALDPADDELAAECVELVGRGNHRRSRAQYQPARSLHRRRADRAHARLGHRPPAARRRRHGTQPHQGRLDRRGR